MPDYLPEVSTRHLRPTRGVRDTSTAEAVEGFGKIAIEGRKEYQKAGLRKDLQALEKEAYGDDTLPTQDEVDSMTVEQASTEFKRLGNARTQKMGQHEYRIRAEVLLKEKINESPALASELRRTAANTIGFDPSGAYTARQEELSDLAVRQKLARRKADEEEARSIGLNPDLIDTPEGQERLNQHRFLKQRVVLAQQKAALQPGDMNAVASAETSEFNAVVEDTWSTEFGDEVSFRDATPEQIASIPEEKRRAYIQSLEERKQNVDVFLRRAYPNASDAQRESIHATITAQADLAIAKLNLQDNVKDLQSRQDMQVLLAQKELLGTPAGKQLAAWSAIAPGSDVPAALETAAMSQVVRIMEGRPAEFPQQREGEGAGEAEKATKEIVEVTRDWLKNIRYEALDEQQVGVVNRAVEAFSEGLANGADSMTPNQHQSILEALADPATKHVFEGLDGDNDAVRHIEFATRSYAHRTAVAAGKSMEEAKKDVRILRPSPHHRRAPAIIEGSSIRVYMDKGLVRVENRDPRTQIQALNLKKNYLKRINTSIKALSNVSDMSMEDAASAIMTGNEASFSWIEGAPQPEAPPAVDYSGHSDGIYRDATGQFIIRNGKREEM